MDDLVTSSTLPSFQLRNNMYNKKNITTIKEGGFQMSIKTKIYNMCIIRHVASFSKQLIISLDLLNYNETLKKYYD